MAKASPGSLPTATNGALAGDKPAPSPSPVNGRAKKSRGPAAALARRTVYTTSIHPGQGVPDAFADAAKALEKDLGLDLWLLVHRGGPIGIGALGPELVTEFLDARSQMKRGRPMALLIDSPGGYAKCAWQLAETLRGHCSGFAAVIPRSAKSAATILTLGASPILLGEHAELGPLDAQYLDAEREAWASALDEVQTFERLHAVALEMVDGTMSMLLESSGKKVETLLPHSIRFISSLMRPLFEKIDAVHYTQMSRVLKVAEEYAIRLLRYNYPPAQAAKIARHLVEHYPEHDFAINAAEAATFGLRTQKPSQTQQRLMDQMAPFLRQITAIGRLKEVRSHGK